MLDAISDDIDAELPAEKEVYVGADIYLAAVAPQKRGVKVRIKLKMSFDDVMRRLA